jgi:CubicO group peptidase (beta-lactamase class C family)
MNRIRLILALMMAFLFCARIFPQPQVQSGSRDSIVRAYIEAFNSGSDDRLRNFFQSYLPARALEERPIEARIERTKLMRSDLKSLELKKLIAASPTELSAEATAGNGETLTLTFTFEPTSPPMLATLRIELGQQAPMDIGPPMTRDDLIPAIERYLGEQVRDDKFSGAVLVARDTSILFTKAYGYAEKRFNIPNRIDTKFNLGSINKFFTRLAIGQLAEKGILSLDDTVIKLLPDYPNKKVAQRVTVKQLIQMTSGMGDFFGPKYAQTPKGKIRTLNDYLQLFVDEPLLFEPGTQERYSNAGYIVLGLIVEKLSGQDYYTYVREHIFRPAGMLNTDSYPMDGVTPNLAAGYTHPEGNDTTWVSNIYSAPGRGSSAGGGYSTVEDLFRFLQALRNGKLLSARYSAWMLTRDLPSTNPPLPLKQGIIGIAGGAPGINAAIEFDAEMGNTVIVLGNYDPPNAQNVARKIRGMMRRFVE